MRIILCAYGGNGANLDTVFNFSAFFYHILKHKPLVTKLAFLSFMPPCSFLELPYLQPLSLWHYQIKLLPSIIIQEDLLSITTPRLYYLNSGVMRMSFVFSSLSVIWENGWIFTLWCHDSIKIHQLANAKLLIQLTVGPVS